MTESKTASVTQLEDNKVRLDVEVSGEAVKEGVEAKVDELKQQVRVPGFRPGKAPRRVIESQVGKDYLYMEALQERLPQWYSRAVVETEIRPIDQPQIDFEESPDEENGFKFSATVEVRPEAKLGEYKGLEVPKREAGIDEEQVEEQIEEMRGQFATLAAVEGRPAQEGDFAIIDFKGELMSGGELPGGEAEDYMLEIGKGELLEDFENNVVGMSAGERKQFAVTFPMDYGEESLRGQSVLFRVHVKEIKERELPPLDDDFAAEASEFDTLEEFRQGVRDQLGEQLQQQIQGEFRGRALDEAAKNAEVLVPEPMVDEKAGEMLQSFERSIQQQGLDPQQYYQIAGVDPEEMKQRVRPDAEDTVKKELVLDAVAVAEGLEADEETVMHEVGHLAEESGRSAEQVVATMRANGTYSMLEEEVVRQKALELIAESAVPVEMPEEEQEEAEELEGVEGEARAGTSEEANEETEETNETDEEEEGQK
ncbi:trigger factor [Rubrobacter aplysinae]|uniref:trigger factor n=1 Tax=Rubrobacter aplysinae TaxID=909625 RepID=UPI00069FD6D3|nr:trigger factor [Rubrobacter aplysinae]